MSERYNKEKALYEYKGADQMVSSKEIERQLEQTKENQIKFATRIHGIDSLLDGVEGGELIVVTGPSGNGKCFGKGTKIMMFDGSTKNVEDIKIGDKLMGDDSKPRKVLSLGRGRSMLYEIKQSRGNSYVVNGEHILCLKETGTYKETTITVNDYLKKSNNYKTTHKGYRNPVSYKKKKVKLDPYYLGLWLGDGSSKNNAVTKPDKEIFDFLTMMSTRYGLKLVNHGGKEKCKTWHMSGDKNKNNPITELLREYNLLFNKHIPKQYLFNSEEIRLQVLAGLIDSDGYVNSTGYSFVNKNKELVNQVGILARSLGFRTYQISFLNKKYQTIYHKIHISGDGNRIPVKILRKKVPKRKINKNVLVNGIEVREIGVGDYYGFEIDGNKKFLLWDCTVAHNTELLVTITKMMLGGDSKLPLEGSKLTNTVIEPTIAWFTLEVTQRQFLARFNGNVPLFYMPKENTDNNIQWLIDRIIEANVKYNVNMVFVDHLHQIMALDHFNGKNLSLEIGEVVAKLKDIAIRYNMVIWLIAHSTDDKERINREPKMTDVRDSGMIVRLADAVMGVWRIPNSYSGKESTITDLGPDDTKAKVRIWKNRRNGKLGFFTMKLVDKTFIEVPVEEDFGAFNGPKQKDPTPRPKFYR